MLGIPSLSEVIRTTDNQRKYRQLTGAGPFDPINWLDAEREAQAMQPAPQPEAPIDPGQARLNATTVNPATGRREWKPGKFGGPATGLSASPPLPVSPSSSSPPQWDAQPVGFGGDGYSPRRNPRGSGADPFDPGSKFANGQYYAQGGTIQGPGGPTDDQVPAVVNGVKPIAVSSGERIVKASTRDWFGEKTYVEMDKKADEGRAAARSGTPPATSHQSPNTGYARGGTITNPYADDPALYAARQREAADAQLKYIDDAGGGYRVSKPGNPYEASPGFATPGTGAGASEIVGPDHALMRNTGTPTRPRLESVPDVVPAGNPWSTGGAMPDLNQRARAASNTWQADQIRAGAAGRRATDAMHDTTKAVLIPKGRSVIGAGGRGLGAGEVSNPYALTTNHAPFMAPWEKDANARRERDAPIQPLLDAGMRRTDIRRILKTPDGWKIVGEMQEARNRAPINQAQPVILPDGSESKDHYMVNGMTLPFGKRKDASTDDLPKRLRELDALIADTKQPLHIRELARRERESAARETIAGKPAAAKAPVLKTFYDEKGNPTQMQWDETAQGWTPPKMAAAPVAGAGGPGASTSPANPAAARIAALRAKAGLK